MCRIGVWTTVLINNPGCYLFKGMVLRSVAFAWRSGRYIDTMSDGYVLGIWCFYADFKSTLSWQKLSVIMITDDALRIDEATSKGQSKWKGRSVKLLLVAASSPTIIFRLTSFQSPHFSIFRISSRHHLHTHVLSRFHTPSLLISKFTSSPTKGGLVFANDESPPITCHLILGP